MMKKVFLDTNVLIDYLARRGQFFQPAAQIVQLGQDRQCELLVAAINRHWESINKQITKVFNGEKTISINLGK